MSWRGRSSVISRMMNRGIGLALIAVLWLAPRAAQACAVCSTGREDETRVAFIVTTAFMTALPLLVLGGGFWLLRRHFQRTGQLGSSQN